MEALEKQLLPLKRQAALGLYNAGMKDGLLSGNKENQCREAWWIQLCEMDEGIQCSDGGLFAKMTWVIGISW